VREYMLFFHPLRLVSLENYSFHAILFSRGKFLNNKEDELIKEKEKNEKELLNSFQRCNNI